MRMNSVAAAALIVAALGMGATAPAMALGGEKVAKVQAPVSFDPHVSHVSEAENLIWVNQPDGARGIRKVVVTFFQVQFVTDSKASASGAGGAHTAMDMHLDGPTPDQMQAITDEVYKTFLDDMRATGIEVITPEQARTYSAYTDLLAHSKSTGEVINGMGGVKSSFFSPAGLPMYLLPTSLPVYSGGGPMTPMDNAQNIRREALLLEQSGAAVVGFRAVVDFATLTASNRKGLRMLARDAKTKGQAGLVIRPVSTQMFLITPNTKAETLDPHNRMRLELQTPLEIESNAVLATDDATTKGARTAENVVNALGFLTGTGTSKSRSYDVKVDKDMWQSDVTAALKGLSATMTARLKTGL